VDEVASSDAADSRGVAPAASPALQEREPRPAGDASDDDRLPKGRWVHVPS
jgi:hypothetical protein